MEGGRGHRAGERKGLGGRGRGLGGEEGAWASHKGNGASQDPLGMPRTPGSRATVLQRSLASTSLGLYNPQSSVTLPPIRNCKSSPQRLTATSKASDLFVFFWGGGCILSQAGLNDCTKRTVSALNIGWNGG